MGFFFLIIILVTPAKPKEMTSDDRRNLELRFYFLTAFYIRAHLNRISVKHLGIMTYQGD